MISPPLREWMISHQFSQWSLAIPPPLPPTLTLLLLPHLSTLPPLPVVRMVKTMNTANTLHHTTTCLCCTLNYFDDDAIILCTTHHPPNVWSYLSLCVQWRKPFIVRLNERHTQRPQFQVELYCLHVYCCGLSAQEKCASSSSTWSTCPLTNN